MRRQTGIVTGVMIVALVGVGACAAPTPTGPAEVPVVQADISTPTTDSQAAPPAEESAPDDDSAPPPQPQSQPSAIPTRTPGGSASATSTGTGGSTGGSGPGTITGALRYPSEGHPPMRVYALRTDGQRWQFINAQANQFNYTIQLEAPGDYYVVAYVLSGDAVQIAGGYSPNGKCVGDAGGDYSGCTLIDSSLLAVTVEAGQTYSGIDIVDWGPPEDYPPLPS